jgi:hypothetical protein
MEKFKKQIAMVLSASLLLQTVGATALGAGLQCRIIFDQQRLSALQTLSQDQRTSLTSTLWQRLINGKALSDFSVEKYKQDLGALLSGEKHITDQEIWQSTEGKLALIEFLNVTSGNALKADDILTRLENLKAFSQRSLMKMINAKLDANSALSVANLDQWSHDFFLLLRGANVRTLDYLTMNSSDRMQKQLGGLLQEELLSFGLKGVLGEMGLPEATIKDRVMIIVQKLMQSSSFVRSMLAFRLPEAKPVQISAPLLTKVLIDGADAHKAELEAELAPQIGRNRYEVARRWIGPMLLTASVFYFYTGSLSVTETGSNVTATEVIESRHTHDQQAVTTTLETTAASVQQVSLNLDAIRYESTLNYLNGKWGRWPTSSETQYLLTQIYGGQLSSAQIQKLIGDIYQGQVSVPNGDALQGIPDRANQIILNQNQ